MFSVNNNVWHIFERQSPVGQWPQLRGESEATWDGVVHASRHCSQTVTYFGFA